LSHATHHIKIKIHKNLVTVTNSTSTSSMINQWS